MDISYVKSALIACQILCMIILVVTVSLSVAQIGSIHIAIVVELIFVVALLFLSNLEKCIDAHDGYQAIPLYDVA